MAIVAGNQALAADVLALVSDTAYGPGWNGVTGVAPSKNAVYDKMENVAVIFDTTGVYNANSPAAMTDLDLSAVVGANQAVCLLKVYNDSGDATTQSYQFRKNGDADNVYVSGISTTNNLAVPDDQFAYILIVTDASGIVEWTSNLAKTTVITMEAYWIHGA